MGLLSDTADFFKARKIPIKRWFKDDGGRYGFRVDVKGEAYYVAALSQTHNGGEISVMSKLVRRAADHDAMMLVRVRDEYLVFEPDTFKTRNKEGVINDERRKRGEKWLHVPVSWGADFRSYTEGRTSPRERYGDLRDWADA